MAYCRFVIADDNVSTRQALRHLLEIDTGLVVVGEAADGADAVAVTVASRPDLVILDDDMPGLDDADTTRIIRQKSSRTRVLIFSSQDSDAAIHRALQAGAAGYALKGEIQELLRAVETVVAGRLYLSPQLERHTSRQMKRSGR